MENFDQIFTLIAEHEGIGLNTDILETGLINIVALIAILVYTGRDFLGSALEKQLSQASIVISEIKNETIAAKKVLLEADAYQAKKDLTTRFSRALATFNSKERQVFLEVKQQIILLVLKRTVVRAQETFGPKERAGALINETINKLEGDLL